MGTAQGSETIVSFKQKNVVVTLVNFSLILAFYVLRLAQLVQNDNFVAEKVFWLWGIVVILAIFASIAGMILTHIVSAVFEAVRTGNEEPDIEDLEDERDELIDLKGTSATYTLYSLGVFASMLTFVIGQPALLMFALLILFGLLAQIVGDVRRLRLYQRGI